MEAVLLTKNESLSLGPLDGARLIKNSNDVFRKSCSLDFSENALSDTGAPTPEIVVDVFQISYLGDSFEKICNRLPGKWNQKFLTQHQVIEFCFIYKRWLGLYSEPTVFICKKDESESVYENNPEENLLVVYIDYSGRNMKVHITSVLECDVWHGEGLVRIVLPRV